MDKVAIVTDSTADFSLDYYKQNNVVMVPLNVFFGEEQYKDWVDIEPKEFYQRLVSSETLPHTSQPSPAEFVEAYERLKLSCDAIISCHISSSLSGTINSAQLAKTSVEGVRIEIIDTGSTSSGLGLIVDQLAKDRDNGLEVDEMVQRGHHYSKKLKLVFAVDTLEFLQKGGRIGKASAFLGSVLNIKPLLIVDKEVLPYKRIRGASKVNGELVAYVKEGLTGKSPLHLSILHSMHAEGVEELKAALTDHGIVPSVYWETNIGAVIGTHVGPKALGIAFFEE